MCILAVSVSDTVWCHNDLKTKAGILDVNRMVKTHSNSCRISQEGSFTTDMSKKERFLILC